MAKLEIDEALVRKLAVLLEETGLTELEVEAGQQRIRVTRGGSTAASIANSTAAILPAGPVSTPSPAASEPSPPNALLSPMVGTAYVAPEPGAAPFVSLGSKVAKGDTLLIIEAMKVMNPLHAPHPGTVTQILVSDGMPVEFGQPLLVIE
ncbi:MAG TPA: acetyl-CoA carboxylase biotin carboxyl carrier protein [Alphaproteobacteria bacterium]|nr:acetyl-CoA carboxylase biotin carboxyl carrier protein [Alphaproteobacteria bacterium]